MPNAQISVPFWIDTLSVPVQNPECRRLAITGMRKIYRSAAFVMVLESSMYGTDLPEDTPTVLFRIGLSAWTRRLWTLQEGLFAQYLGFVFRDRRTIIDVSGSLRRGSRKLIKRRDIEIGKQFEAGAIKRSYIMSLLDEEEKTLFEEFWRHLNPIYSMSMRIADLCVQKPLWQETHLGLEAAEGSELMALIGALKWRSTTKAEDEATCLATLTYRDVGNILSVPPESRMKAFLTTYNKVPANIVFGKAPRESSQGYGWMPKTLLHFTLAEPKESAFGKRTPNGLMVSFPGLVFDLDPGLRSVKNFIRMGSLIQDFDGFHYFLSLTSDEVPFTWEAFLGWRMGIFWPQSNFRHRTYTQGVIVSIRRLEEHELTDEPDKLPHYIQQHLGEDSEAAFRRTHERAVDPNHLWRSRGDGGGSDSDISGQVSDCHIEAQVTVHKPGSATTFGKD